QDGLFYADEPGEYSKWRSDPSDIENQVLLVNTAAKFNGIPQAIQYYSGSFTTYGKSDKSAFRFELYTTDEHLWDENGEHCLLCGEPSPGSGAILGDANLDGDVNINDVTTIQYYLAELIDSESICFEAADVDLSGELDIFDATTLQMYLADFELPYEIGKMRVSTLAADVN
ncbi:MAG: dockerin type I repeat-containing protein, partial [Ruminococcus sp.]|nr:dockerin type I repeat-containing protein [Ruminococcus sp.]